LLSDFSISKTIYFVQSVDNKVKVVSMLPPRCWRQQIGWSYCAASRTFSLVAWRNIKKRVTLSGTRCPARGVRGQVLWLLCQGLAVRLSPCKLSFFFFAFFQALL